MSDAEFLNALEACELPDKEFGHVAHVRVAYLYLREMGFAETLARMRRTIRSFAEHLGRPDRYHETITVAYVALIQQHIVQRGHGEGWQAFASQNPELFHPALLGQFYPQAQLNSPLARSIFLLPRSTPDLSDLSCRA